jgi:hypothetical protein
VGDDRKLVTAIERAGPDDGQAWSAGICVVDTGETDRACPLARRALTIRRGKLEERRLAGNLKLILRQDELHAEGAPGPGLAVEAMAGVRAWKARERGTVANSAAATAAINFIGHDAAAYIGLGEKATRHDIRAASEQVGYDRVRP